MGRVFRRDLLEIDKPIRTPEGFLITSARLGRTGVFPYLLQDGTIRREWRPPEEVFKPESIASYRLKPLTLTHPNGPVTPENIQGLQVGSVGDTVEVQAPFVTGPVTVTAQKAIEAVERGVDQLSPGYTVEIDETSGITPEGEEFDVIQRDITVNHVAIVPSGRQGPEVSLRVDEAEESRADAQWTTRYINDLPDSAFLFIEPGGSKDGENKTVPRLLRHFPVRDKNGELDRAHVTNALAQIPKSNVSESAKKAAQTEAQKLLAQLNSRTDSKPGVTGSSTQEGRPVKIKILRQDALKRRIARKDDDGDFDGDDFDTMEDDAAGMVQKLADRHDAMKDALTSVLKDRADALQSCADKDDVIKGHEATIGDLKKQLETANNKATTAEAKSDELDKKLKEAEKARNDALDPVAIEAVVTNRLRVQKAGEIVVGKDFKVDAADRDLLLAKTAIVKARAPELSAEKLGNKAYVEARFDAIAEELDKTHTGLLSVKLIDALKHVSRGGEQHQDGEDDLAKAAAEHQKRMQSRWDEANKPR
jgi:hypothetical protein